MALFVHLAPEPLASRIRRHGIRARRTTFSDDAVADRFVWAFPVLESHTATYQWSRELKRFGTRSIVAVTFRLPDDEKVFAQHYGQPLNGMSAAEAVALIRGAQDPRGFEVMIPRRIRPDEIVRARVLQKHMGWRYFPEAKAGTRRPCDCPMCMPRGEVRARRWRERVPQLMRRWDERNR